MISKDALVASLIDLGICKSNDIQGATRDEVVALEEAAGLVLPVQYREFLLAVGRGAGALFQGTDIFLPVVGTLTQDAALVLQEGGETASLPDDAFVFSMHQGYAFAHFRASEGDDPPVYQYVEGNGAPALAWPTFSQFLIDAINEHAHAVNK